MGDGIQRRAALLLSIQRALLGEIPPNVRAVTARIDDRSILLRCIIDGSASEQQEEDWSAVGTEVVADFPAHHIEEEIIRCDAPTDLRTHLLEAIAYLRKE